jgi:hypothetical protein
MIKLYTTVVALISLLSIHSATGSNHFGLDSAEAELNRFGLDKTEAECGPHEEYVNCHSSTCFDKTCKDLENEKVMKICSRDCRFGCVCVAGHVRQLDGKCHNESVCEESSS